MTEFGYQISAACQPSADIVIPFLKMSFSRDIMSLICVCSDLLIVLLLYISLICLQNFQDLTKSDIKEHLLTADDFTVCIKDIPATEESDIKELKAYLQQWVECMLKYDTSITYQNPDTQTKDIFQNNIMNIYFGMNEYWKMNRLMQISDILKEVKTY